MNRIPKKLAFIGGGISSAVGYVHRTASQMDGFWTLECGCFSATEEENNRTAQEWNIDPKRIYRDWKQMLDKEVDNVDAVVILTPTPMHMEMVTYVLSLKIPVICEKSLATNMNELRKIKECLKKNNAFLSVTYNYSGYPMLRELRSMVLNNNIGKVNQIHVQMPQEGYLRLNADGSKPVPQDWRLNDDDVPVLSLDLGVHVCQMASFVTNAKPIEVISSNASFGFYSVTDNSFSIIRYSDGIEGLMWFSKSALGHSNGLKITTYGDLGSIEWQQMNPDVLILNDNLGSKTEIGRSNASLKVANEDRYNRFKAGHPTGFIEAFANYYEDVYFALDSYQAGIEITGPYVFGLQDAIDGMELLEAITRSNDSRAWEIVK